MTRSRKTQPPSISDNATAYAIEVTTGVRIAGPYVKAQCQRHLDDIRDGAARGLVWDAEASEKAQGFFSDVLKLNGGAFEASNSRCWHGSVL
jgi:hypothetical protein